MPNTRYWGLFWIAAGLSAHAVIVGRQLESSFFLMLFFWGFVAMMALRGSLEAAQSMAMVMVTLMAGICAAAYVGGTPAPDLAYATFALYPSLVCWICALFYIRYLRRRDLGVPGKRAVAWRWQRHTG